MDIENKISFIKEHIGSYPDFPHEGIIFRDIFAALTNGKVCQFLKDVLVAHMREHHPDAKVIVGLESRGFLFNLLIAAELGIGCAPIRKKGKLPGDCLSVAYTLEYGQDIFEIQRTAIKPDQKVVIIDDLLATGGTLDAAIQLVRKAGGIVDGCIVVIELAFLEGRKKLDAPNIHSLIKY